MNERKKPIDHRAGHPWVAISSADLRGPAFRKLTPAQRWAYIALVAMAREIEQAEESTPRLRVLNDVVWDDVVAALMMRPRDAKPAAHALLKRKLLAVVSPEGEVLTGDTAAARRALDGFIAAAPWDHGGGTAVAEIALPNYHRRDAVLAYEAKKHGAEVPGNPHKKKKNMHKHMEEEESGSTPLGSSPASTSTSFVLSLVRDRGGTVGDFAAKDVEAWLAVEGNDEARARAYVHAQAAEVRAKPDAKRYFDASRMFSTKAEIVARMEALVAKHPLAPVDLAPVGEPYWTDTTKTVVSWRPSASSGEYFTFTPSNAEWQHFDGWTGREYLGATPESARRAGVDVEAVYTYCGYEPFLMGEEEIAAMFKAGREKAS